MCNVLINEVDLGNALIPGFNIDLGSNSQGRLLFYLAILSETKI